jgi:hypothetical protein
MSQKIGREIFEHGFSVLGIAIEFADATLVSHF